MHLPALASTPAPPYFAVIFTSLRTDDHADYEATSWRMIELASEQPGFLGVDSTRDAAGLGITVSYWASEDAIVAWRRHAEHTLARERGRSQWYRHFTLRVARVERAHDWTRSGDGADKRSDGPRA